MDFKLLISAFAALTLTACATASAPVDQRVDVTPDKLKLSETDAVVAVVNMHADKRGGVISLQKTWLCEDTFCETKTKLGEFRDSSESGAYYAVDTQKYSKILTERRLFQRLQQEDRAQPLELSEFRCAASTELNLEPKGRYIARFSQPSDRNLIFKNERCELKVEDADTLVASAQ